MKAEETRKAAEQGGPMIDVYTALPEEPDTARLPGGAIQASGFRSHLTSENGAGRSGG